jgi:hypothetical protein
MTTKPDGGPAFPMPAAEHSQGGHFESYGISLRMYAALQIRIAMGSWSVTTFEGEVINEDVQRKYRAKIAFAEADAMIAEMENE